MAREEDLGGDNVLSLALNSKGHIFAGTRGNGIYSSTDNGDTWSYLALDVAHVRDLLVYESQGVEYIVAAAFQAMRSSDGGVTWTKLLDIEPSFNSVSLALGSEGALYVGTHGPQVEPNDGIVYRSTDNGQTWKSLGHTGPAYVVVPGRDGSVYVGGPMGIAYAPNPDPAKWEFMGPAGIEDLLEFTRDTLFAAKSFDGIMLSTDRGLTWTDWLTDTNGASLALSPQGVLFAGTTRGVFRTVGPVVTRSVRDPRIPETMSLNSVHPNPFHDTVTFSFSIEEPSVTVLRAYDALGRQVASILSRPLSAGQHVVRWNADGLPSGVFFVGLESGASSSSNYLKLVKH